MFALSGFSGQHIYNYLDTRHSKALDLAHERMQRASEGAGGALEEEEFSTWRKVVEWVADPKRKWSPIRKLSDKEYEDRLQEKLIAVEAELAIIDEEIERVRRESTVSVQRGEKRQD